MLITSIQLEFKEKTKENTLAYVLQLLDQAKGSDLVLLPEIWPIGYFSFSRYAKESETIKGPIVQAMRKKAADLKAHLLMGSFVEQDGGKLFNTSLLIDPRGKILARFRKIHLFGYQSQERKLLSPGKKITVVDSPWGKIGLSTCYDLRFPELFRKMVDQGAEIFLVTSAWPYARLAAWTLFNRARAHENLAFLISCNAAGVNAGCKLAGHSMIVNPLGEIVAQGGEKEEIVTAEIDPKMVQSVRKDFSALRDRVFK